MNFIPSFFFFVEKRQNNINFGERTVRIFDTDVSRVAFAINLSGSTKCQVKKVKLDFDVDLDSRAGQEPGLIIGRYTS